MICLSHIRWLKFRFLAHCTLNLNRHLSPLSTGSPKARGCREKVSTFCPQTTLVWSTLRVCTSEPTRYFMPEVPVTDPGSCYFLRWGWHGLAPNYKRKYVSCKWTLSDDIQNSRRKPGIKTCLSLTSKARLSSLCLSTEVKAATEAAKEELDRGCANIRSFLLHNPDTTSECCLSDCVGAELPLHHFWDLIDLVGAWRSSWGAISPVSRTLAASSCAEDCVSQSRCTVLKNYPSTH